MKAMNIGRDTTVVVGGGCGREHKTEHGHIHCPKCVKAKHSYPIIECEEQGMSLHDQLTRMLKELEEVAAASEQQLREAEESLNKATVVRNDLKAELEKAQAALAAMRTVHKG